MKIEGINLDKFEALSYTAIGLAFLSPILVIINILIPIPKAKELLELSNLTVVSLGPILSVMAIILLIQERKDTRKSEAFDKQFKVYEAYKETLNKTLQEIQVTSDNYKVLEDGSRGYVLIRGVEALTQEIYKYPNDINKFFIHNQEIFLGYTEHLKALNERVKGNHDLSAMLFTESKSAFYKCIEFVSALSGMTNPGDLEYNTYENIRKNLSQIVKENKNFKIEEIEKKIFT